MIQGRHLRILMYTCGMGSALRGLAIASHLSRDFPGASFLALTDLPILGRFSLPANFDYVHFPANGSEDRAQEIVPRLRSGAASTQLRRTICATTIESFDPDVIVVDRHPLGLERELAATLEAFRERRSGARLIAGLPDMLGEPQALSALWESTGVIDALERLYDEIWIYGARDVFDAAVAYGLPARVERKLAYTGYLRCQVDEEAARAKALREGIDAETPLVLVSAGSGYGSYALLETYLDFREQQGGDASFQSHLVCGPHMPARDRARLEERSRDLPLVEVNTFHSNFLPYVHAASVVVSTFGYNTCCELLSLDKPAVVVPCQRATSEQLLRARAMAARGLVDLLEPEELGPERLGAMLLARLSKAPGSPGLAVPLEGLENLTKRVLDATPSAA